MSQSDKSFNGKAACEGIGSARDEAVCQADKVISASASKEIMLGSDGVYRWVHELKLLRNPTLLFTLWKLLVGVMLGIYVIDTVTQFGTDGFWKSTTVYALVTIGMLLLVLVSYLIYAAVMGGSYCVLFEMDEKGITHTQTAKQFNKARLISMIAALAADNPGSMGIALIAGSMQSSYSKWKRVKSVVCNSRSGVIKVNAPFSKNQVYVSKEDFSFVRDYILSRCPKAKIKGR